MSSSQLVLSDNSHIHNMTYIYKAKESILTLKMKLLIVREERVDCICHHFGYYAVDYNITNLMNSIAKHWH